MAKKITGYIKLQVKAGEANPSPPIGPALGQRGVNIMEFVKDYNARTAAQTGQVIPVEITIFEDRTFSFVLKTPPGKANALAVELDDEGWDEIVGTVAGDDTILIVTPDNTAAQRLSKKLLSYVT